MNYKTLTKDNLTRELFRFFERRQEVTKCWRKVNGAWVIRDIAFTDQWSEEDYDALIRMLRHTVETGGTVFGAFDPQDRLKGFAALEPEFFGTAARYLDLVSLHVSAEARGQGIGRALFTLAAEKARELGADCLYISGHSAVETQAFYRAMGCVEAKEYNLRHVLLEPADCQLEFRLN